MGNTKGDGWMGNVQPRSNAQLPITPYPLLMTHDSLPITPMNNLLLQPKSSAADFRKSRQSTLSLKLIVFKIGNLNFALRIESDHYL